MIMNTMLIKHISVSAIRTAGLASVIVLSLMACSCSDEFEQDNPNTTPENGKRLCFTANSIPQSRVSHSGYQSTFDNGDEIGCIILYRNKDGGEQAFVNSVWKYKNGVLILDSFIRDYKKHVSDKWGNECEADVYGRQPQEDCKDDLRLICRDENSDADSGYLTLLDENKEYEFYFYYPFIDSESMHNSLRDAGVVYTKLSDKNTPTDFCNLISIPMVDVPSDLTFLKYGSQINTLSPENENSRKDYMQTCSMIGPAYTEYRDPWNNGGSKDGLYNYSWTEYPAFVNTTQWTREQFESSDHLHTSYTVSVNGGSITQASENKTVDLKFKRINAVVELQCEDAVPMESVWFDSQSGLHRGTCLNIKSGQTQQYEYKPDVWESSSQQKGCVVKNPFRPLPMDEGYPNHIDVENPVLPTGSYRNYRMILTAQSLDNFNLHVSIGGSPKVIALHNRIKRLEANHLYIIRLSKSGECTLLINDWENGGYEIIEDIEVKTETEQTE